MIVPSVLTVLAGLRTYWWLRQRHLVRSDADILRNPRATNWLTLPIGAGFTVWSFAALPLRRRSRQWAAASRWTISAPAIRH
ncbi:hypothetical protein LPJ38_33020 [Bradyrhizobium daqingense]|uniref:hypothetical protein n=1 Tax=Bradyrhizobium daqingense TaxID=993502 RepID=UPI00142F08D2|nr:hypothetical protein [Bradyrhizobium daqingense]UFS93034.1 hypothetical protein LPJ38_33020 [Bradyrhizobium daqingense]